MVFCVVTRDNVHEKSNLDASITSYFTRNIKYTIQLILEVRDKSQIFSFNNITIIFYHLQWIGRQEFVSN